MGTHGGARLSAPVPAHRFEDRAAPMTIAARLSSLLPQPRYRRRPRVTAHRLARETLSRETRWKRRGRSSVPRVLLLLLAGGGIAAAGYAVFLADPGPAAEPLAFPDFVAQAETAFPEALHGHTRARGGTLSSGEEVPVALSLLLPAHALDAADAAPDALTRLSAPFVGRDRAISGEEMGARIAALADLALPAGVTRCYSYAAAPPRRVAVSDNRMLHVTPLDIVFNPEC